MKIQKHWLKRLLALALVIVSVVQLLPAQAWTATIENAKSSTSFIPGDVNDDGVVDAKDVNLTRRYIAGGYNVTINTYAADVNADGEINAKDINLTRRHIAGGYNVELQPARLTVSFYDGDRLIDTLTAVKGQPLGAVPSVEKSSKANAFLAGYFTDPECTQPFYAENPVTGDMKVYAKYEDMGTGETLNFTSFAQMDQQADISFEIIGDGDPNQAVTLEVMDGSDPVELKFTETADGYKFYAPEGFNEGCSYQLHLSDGWYFKDKADTLRTASFSIYKEQVENLKMNDDIVYIKDTDAISYNIGGQPYDMLTSELITEQGGSFNYSGAAIEVDDILCIYTGTHPEQRAMDGDVLDPAYYVKAKAVSGSTVTFTALGDNDFPKLYNIPDNFPIKVDALPTGTTGTVNISALDTDMYTIMMGDGYNLATAKEAIEVGDFISMFLSQDSIETEDDLYFAEITAYNAAAGEITYKKTTKQAILDSMDLYRDVEISGNDLVTEEEQAEIEAALLSQISESGFAEDAAFMLADLITKTDGFKNAGIESLLITDSQGNELSPEEIQLLNLGTSFELTDDVKLKVELITKGDQLHYAKGTQIAVGIEAEFEVELEDDEKIAIELNATFIQEVEISPRVKGYIVPYVVFLIPIPVGANVNGTVDIKSFTAFSFEAEVYTVAPEEKELWDQFKEIIEDPRKLADLPGMPEELAKGLNTVGDVFDKIKELEDNMAKVKDKAEQYQGYAEDLEAIWAYVEENGLTTKADWKGMCEALDKTSITSDLLDMMGLTNETELKTEYYESLEALMERYCEMVEKETDWVTLVNKDLFARDVFLYGVSIGIDVDFVVRADLSLAIGSNLQYEVGKRYEFYFKFAPFFKKVGSNTMDLLDERFAFQFYVMGRLGVKAGIRAKLEFGIGSCLAANVGVALELGPYMKFWGFFVYEYEKYRPAGTSEWNSDERMAGALLMEFGLYIKMAFEAEAIDGLFSYEYEFLDEEIPLLTIGDEKFYYQPNYEPAEGETVLVKDVDSNSSNGITMTLPAYAVALDYVNMKEGYMAIDSPDYDRFHYTVSNPNFSIDRNTGLISVNVPEDTRYMECDLTITYKYGKLAFSTYDMTVTVPLVWTNLTTEELNEYFTAAVRVGNDTDGYTTIWQQRVLKNQEYDLPTADEIKELIGWNEYKYDMGTGYGSQQTEDLTLIEDEVYDFNIDYDTYSIKVANVQKADGTTETRTYYAQYGEMFDFSDLADTGTDANGVYTKFSELTHNTQGLDLDKAIDSRMADVLANGVTVNANYVDNSITAIFIFEGLDAQNVAVVMRRGNEPDLAQIQKIVEDAGLAIKDIAPVITPITASTMYQVICGELDTKPATITFEENGGNTVADITKPYGSLIGNLPTPEKTGHTFAGWYADEALNQRFDLTKIPQGGATAYAKWIANAYTVTLHVNGGNALNDNDMTVTYGEAYGELPAPTKNGYSFIGWFTDPEGGAQITKESIYNLTEDQILYARWFELQVISDTVFDFGDFETGTYQYNTVFAPEYTFTAEEGETYKLDEFKFEYLCQGYIELGYVDQVTEAGTYDVRISRPADDTYAKFEGYYTAVLTVEQGVRDLASENLIVEQKDNGFTYLDLQIASEIFDLDEDAMFQYTVSGSESRTVEKTETARIFDLNPGKTYNTVKVTVDNDRNYEKAEITLEGCAYTTLGAPAASWAGSEDCDTSWYDATKTEFTLTTPAQFAGFAKLANNGNGDIFLGKTVKLGADVDMRAHSWTPINLFKGTFDGQGHTISGVYYSGSSNYVGLFGQLSGNITLGEEGLVTNYAVVENVVLDDSYISGKASVGGIAATTSYAIVNNCTSYAQVRGSDDSVGGIVGHVSLGYVVNCVNHGSVSGGGRFVGGIVGLGENNWGDIVNNANFGSVYAGEKGRVGGIAGLTNGSGYEVLNNYNCGTVSANDPNYIGSIVGRNESNDGEVKHNYYLYKCAVYDGRVRNALGSDYTIFNKGATVDDGGDYPASSFEKPTSGMKSSAGKYAGKTLINALNEWVEENAGNYTRVEPAKWVAETEDGYPLPVGSPVSALRK